MTITGQQASAARHLLKWTQSELGGEASVSASTIGHFEIGRRQLSAQQVDWIQRALQDAGVAFGGGEPGVKMRAKAKKAHTRVSCQRK